MLAVEIQERIENGYLRICLGFPHSFTLIELYNKTIQHQLPLSSVTEEFKSAKSQSRGCRIRQAGRPNTIGASITQYMCIMVRGTNRFIYHIGCTKTRYRMRHDKVLMWWRMKEQDRGTAVRRKCHPNYEGGCKTWKKEVQIIRVQHGGRPRHESCLSRHRKNNFATRHGALDQTSKNDICHRYVSTLGWKLQWGTLEKNPRPRRGLNFTQTWGRKVKKLFNCCL